MTTTKQKWRKPSTERASRCSHCRQERFCASLTELQALNRHHPIPGVFSTLLGIENECGTDALVLVCVGCFCFQPVGFLGSPHAH